MLEHVGGMWERFGKRVGGGAAGAAAAGHRRGASAMSHSDSRGSAVDLEDEVRGVH